MTGLTKQHNSEQETGTAFLTNGMSPAGTEGNTLFHLYTPSHKKGRNPFLKKRKKNGEKNRQKLLLRVEKRKRTRLVCSDDIRKGDCIVQSVLSVLSFGMGQVEETVVTLGIVIQEKSALHCLRP